MVNYLHEIPVKSPFVCTLSIMSVIAPIHASSVPYVHPSDDEHQKIPDEFTSTSYGEKDSSEISAKFPDDVALTLHQTKLLEKTLGNYNGVEYLAIFPLTQKWATKIHARCFPSCTANHELCAWI